MDLKPLARQEREEFAELLTGLSPEQWEAPTLCAGWRVRDVVAHVISYDGLSLSALVRRFAQGRFLLGRANAVGVADYGSRTPDELLALFAARLEPRGLVTAFGGRIGLTDAMVHQQDVRRPLGIPRQIPAERLVPALRFAYVAPALHGFWHTRGVRLVATDLDWAIGRGPEARGTAEALLMTIAGRRGVVAELSGPGQPILAARIEGS